MSRTIIIRVNRLEQFTRTALADVVRNHLDVTDDIEASDVEASIIRRRFRVEWWKWIGISRLAPKAGDRIAFRTGAGRNIWITL